MILKNIAFVSIGTGGTMGHMTLTTKISEKLHRLGHNCFIFSEYEYEKFSATKKDISFVNLPKQEHMRTVAGRLEYKYGEKVIELLIANNIELVIFSTLFDQDVLVFAKKAGIKTALISYSLRDSHRKAFELRKYYSLFDKIITLKDFYDYPDTFANEVIVSPFIDHKNIKKSEKTKDIKKVLITCGGGGRPSSMKFFDLIKESIPALIKQNPELVFTIIKGNADFNLSLPNTNIIEWSVNFKDLIGKNALVISESGFFTCIDILLAEKPAILIPGERRIDNQELRALEFESKGLGFCVFPEDGAKGLIRKFDEIKLKISKGNGFLLNNHLIVDNISKLRSIESVLEEIIK